MPQNEDASGFKPRRGQLDLIESLNGITRGRHLSIQWPTGYGKSIGFALAWRRAFELGIAKRLLLVVANDTQRQQIKRDFPNDCILVGAPTRADGSDGGIHEFDTLYKSARTRDLIVVCTVHKLSQSERDASIGGVFRLLDSGDWMVGFDEYHHFGEGMAWGNAAKKAMEMAAFSMAMSATPYRRGSQTVFPEPGQVVTYTQAVDEKAVKPIVCHSYNYEVTVVTADNEVVTYTTDELMSQADGPIGPNGLTEWEERQQIRYSAQYIEPLIVNPIVRLGESRAATGVPLQMLVRAMSCRHAQMVCEQIRAINSGLRVEWIGTGPNGRTDEENRKIISEFCPPKDEFGIRKRSTIDVLVQVAMAGEGFDSVNVSEIIDLYPVSSKAKSGRATQDKQFYGRGSRVIPGVPGVRLHVNIPSDHPLHGWAGRSLADWMDAAGDEISPRDLVDGQEDGGGSSEEDWRFPPFPVLNRDIKLLQINQDSVHYKEFRRLLLNDHPYVTDDEVVNYYKFAAKKELEERSEQAYESQVRDYMDGKIGKLAYTICRRSKATSSADIGARKKWINSKLKQYIGKSRELWTEADFRRASEWMDMIGRGDL